MKWQMIKISILPITNGAYVESRHFFCLFISVIPSSADRRGTAPIADGRHCHRSSALETLLERRDSIEPLASPAAT